MGWPPCGSTLTSAPAPPPLVATLPPPYRCSRAAHADTSDRNRLMVDLAQQRLRPAFDAAVKAGAKVVHLEEPWVAYFGIEQGDWAPFAEALQSLKPAAPVTVILHCYFGDAGRSIDQLKRLPVDGIGVDLVETDLSELGQGWDKDLLIGCLNGRSSIVEPLDATVALARRVADTVRPRHLYRPSTCEPGFLPPTVPEAKVQTRVQAAKRLNELIA